VYYSFTHQTERAATCLEKTFIEAGCEARTCRLDFAGDAPEFPLRPVLKRALELGLPSMRERPVPVSFDESVLDQEWDLVVIGSPTWVLSPAQPVSSFLQTPAATQLLSARPFGVFVVCRGFWRRNLARVRTGGGPAAASWMGPDSASTATTSRPTTRSSPTSSPAATGTPAWPDGFRLPMACRRRHWNRCAASAAGF
jgi:hypothetical protein